MKYLAHDYQQTAVVATLHLEKVNYLGFCNGANKLISLL